MFKNGDTDIDADADVDAVVDAGTGTVSDFDPNSGTMERETGNDPPIFPQFDNVFVVVVFVNVVVIVVVLAGDIVVIIVPILFSITAPPILFNGRPTSFIRSNRDTKSSNSTICRTVSVISCMSSEGGEKALRPNQPRSRGTTKPDVASFCCHGHCRRRELSATKNRRSLL